MKSRPQVPAVKDLLSTALLVEGGILLLASLLRLWDLDMKPAHFDEGINGWFVDQMRVNGFYRYDPENYHGPLYFYVLFVFLTLGGRNLWALRLPAVIASIASVWVALRFDRFLGSSAARLGALALSVSPAAVFYGRYAIHESWVVLALMILTVGLLGLWRDGSRRGLIFVFAGGTALLLLKETALIHLVCFALAGLCLMLWQKLVPSLPSQPFARRFWKDRDAMLFLGISATVLVFFYSGSFLNWQGVPDFFRAYGKWCHTGVGAGGHEKNDYQFGSCGLLNWYWVALMVRYEWPALLGLLVAVRLAWPAPPMIRYLAIYALGVLAAYSIVPYKTPWCIISILWPYALLWGAGVAEFSKISRMRTLSLCLAVIALAGSLVLCIRVNFFHCTDPKEPYVYVQTQPGIAVVTAPLLELAAQDPRRHDLSGVIMLESYYPLPWILGDFTRIGYYGKENEPATIDADFVTALSSRDREIEQKLSGPYLKRRYLLRDSMDECTVWFREPVFASWFADGRHGKPQLVKPRPVQSPIHSPSPTVSSSAR
jgi:uncharacterized protein (TIGR03663 family)